MKRIFEKYCKEVMKFQPNVYFLHPVQAAGVTIRFNKWLRSRPDRFPHWYSANKFQILKWMKKGIGRVYETQNYL